MIDCIGLVYAETKIELLGPIKSGTICYKKTNKTMTWLIIQVQSTLKTTLTYCDESNQVWSMTKTRQDMDVTECISVVYTETKTKLFVPIWPSVVYNEN